MTMITPSELTPEDAAAYNNRGIAKRHLGDTEGAIDDYNKRHPN